MNPIYRRVRRRNTPSKTDGAFFKKESQETFFSSGSEHDSFFKSDIVHDTSESIRRKCEKCEEDEKEVKRQPEKKEEEKVMKKEDRKEEEKIQRQPEKKEEEKKVMRVEEKKEEEKVMKKEDKKEEEKLQREPEKKEEEKLQKKEATSSGGSKSVSNYINSLSGKGESLPPATNQFFSGRMGYDFSDVRVHHDNEAAESAKAVNAKAYTVGNNIVFNEGKYDTNSDEGKKLMAHELSHVTQNAPEEKLSRKKTVAQEKNLDLDTTVSSSMPPTIDEILAASNVLKPYIDVKNNLIAEKGKFKIEIGYENLKIAHKECFGREPDGTIGGFFCRKTGVIHTVAGKKKEPTSVLPDVIHEAIHKKSSEKFMGIFTDFINEGVTQYFTDKVLVEQGLGAYKGHRYGAELKCAEDLIRVAGGMEEVAKCYFQGDTKLIDILNKKLSKELKGYNLHHISAAVRKKPIAEFFCEMLKNKK